MINKLPFIGWFLSFIANTSLSIPFWYIWSSQGLGEKYFYFVPEIYYYLPFWNCVGLFMLIGILKGCFPTLVKVSQTNNSSN